MSSHEEAAARLLRMATVDRRTLLQHSLGLATFGSIFGLAEELAAAKGGVEQPAAASSGIVLPRGMRRIVTGHDAEGKSYVVSDERITGGGCPNLFKTTGVDPFGPGPANESRTLRPTTAPRLEPEVGGANFVFVTFPPTKPGAELGWHRTETVDINVLLSGELILVLEKEEVTLQPGDAVIQRNTMHAWKNPTDAPVYWAAVLVPIRQRS